MTNKLIFEPKSVYGRTLFYPKNKEALAICRVAGRKTLTKQDLQTLEGSGVRLDFDIDKAVDQLCALFGG